MQLTKKQIDNISSRLRWSSLSVEPLEGGFTGSTKYILSDNYGEKLFLKVTDLNSETVQAINAIREVENYKILKKLKLKSFPGSIDHFIMEGSLYLIIQYIEGNFNNLRNEYELLKLLDTLKDLSLSEVSIDVATKLKAYEIYVNELIQHAHSKIDYAKPYIKDQKLFNGKNEEIGNCKRKWVSKARKDSKPNLNPRGKLCLVDVNFGNVGVSRSGEITLVDPVYLTVGDPRKDYAVATTEFFIDRGIDGEVITKINEKYFEGSITNYLNSWLLTFSDWSGQGDNSWNKFMLSRARSCLALLNSLDS